MYTTSCTAIQLALFWKSNNILNIHHAIENNTKCTW